MERRYFLALLLAAVVVAITQILFPVARPTPPASVKRDTNSVVVPAPQAQTNIPSVVEEAQPVLADSANVLERRPEITMVETERSIYEFSNIGATPVSVRLKGYKNLAPAGGDVELQSAWPATVEICIGGAGRYSVARPGPIPYDRQGDPAAGGALSYSASVSSMNVTISYGFVPDRYMVRINGRIDGQAQNVFLLTQLPSTLRPAESDTVADLNNLAYSFKPQRDNARIVQFGKLDPGEQELEAGPLTWAAVKNKYFVFGLLNAPGSTFNEVNLKGGPRTSKLATTASATIVKAIQGGAFAMELYAGPQQ